MSVNGDILTPNLDLKINSFPITLFHVFSIKGQYVEVITMMNPTSISTKFSLANQFNERSYDKTAFSDGFIGFKLGVINSKTVSLQEYASKKVEFVMMSYLRIWYSGSYDEDELVNIATNRTIFEYGLPTTMALWSKGNYSTNLELFPSIRFFYKKQRLTGKSNIK